MLDYKINAILDKDLKYIVKNDRGLLQKFKNKNILVTGATGLVARVLIYVLIYANNTLKLSLNIYAVIRNKEKAKRQYKSFLDCPELHFVVQDIKDEFVLDCKVDYIFHAAAVTDSKTLIKVPVEAFQSQILGMINILQLAKKNQSRVVYFSSMEIYGQPYKGNGRTTEEELGYVNPLVIRNGYPESKRSNEFLSAAYAKEYGVSVVNARLAQTFGPGVDIDDSRVFAQFIRSAMKKESLILHTNGESVGNYCYLRDTIQAIIKLCFEGHSGESYNVVNESTTVSIKEMAELVAKKFGNGKVIIQIPNENMGYAPKVDLRLSGKKLQRLGWQPTVGLKDMFERTIESLDGA